MLDPSMCVDETLGASAMDTDVGAFDQSQQEEPPFSAGMVEWSMPVDMAVSADAASALDSAQPAASVAGPVVASDDAQNHGLDDDICRMRIMDSATVQSMMMHMTSDIEHASRSISNVSEMALLTSIAITETDVFALDVAVDDPHLWLECCMTAFKWIGTFRANVASKQPLNTAKLLDRCYTHMPARRTVCTGLVLLLVPGLGSDNDLVPRPSAVEARLCMLVDWIMRVEHITDHTALTIEADELLRQIHGKMPHESVAVYPECNLIAAAYIRVGARFFEPANRKRSLLCPEITAWFMLMYTKMPFQTLHDAFALLPIARASWATALLPSVHIMSAACTHANAVALCYDAAFECMSPDENRRSLEINGRLIELVLLVLDRCTTLGMSGKYGVLASYIETRIWDTTDSSAFHKMQAFLPSQNFEYASFSEHKRELNMFCDVTPKRLDSLVFLLLECVWSAEHARLNGVYVKIDPRTGNVVNRETRDMHGRVVVVPVETSYNRLCNLCTMAVQMMMRFYRRRAVRLLLEEHVFNASLGAYASKTFSHVHGEFLRAWACGRISHTELATLTEGSAAIDTDTPIPDICQLMLALDTLANTSPKPAAMIFGRVSAWVGTIDNADIIMGSAMDAFRQKVMDTSDSRMIAELLM